MLGTIVIDDRPLLPELTWSALILGRVH